MEAIEIGMLCLVSLLILDSVLDKKLIDLGFKEEGDVDKVVSQFVEEASGAFDLEGAKLVQILPQLLGVGISGVAVLAHLVPNCVHISDFVLQEELVRETCHDVLDLCVGGGHEDAAALLDFILSLTEVVVELVDVLVAFVDGGDVALTAAVALGLNHHSTLFRADHLHLEASALNLSLVDFGGFLFGSKDGLRDLFHVFERLKLLFA